VTRRILPGKWMRRARLRTGLLVQLVWRPSKRCAPTKSELGQFRIQLRTSGVTVPRILRFSACCSARANILATRSATARST
jgi:hypothetical protein